MSNIVRFIKATYNDIKDKDIYEVKVFLESGSGNVYFVPIGGTITLDEEVNEKVEMI